MYERVLLFTFSHLILTVLTVFFAMVVLTCFVMCGFCKVWVHVCVDFVMCECFGNVHLYLLRFFIVFTVFLYCFVYVYYLFRLYWCKDYCHRVKTQLQ
jgi:hypothetical protein